MTRRTLVFILIAAGVLIAGYLFWRNSEWETITYRSPPRGEALTNRYYTLEHLLAQLGVKVREVKTLRELPAGGMLYIPDFRLDFAHRDLTAIESWVEQGGRLVIPGWVLTATPEIARWSAVSPVEHPRRAGPLWGRAVATRTCQPWHVSLRGRLTPQSLCLELYPLEEGYNSRRTPRWSLADEDGHVQMLRIALSEGELTVIGPEVSLIGNQALIKDDHARAFLAATDIRTGDTLLILNPSNAEALPALLWRLIAPAIVFLALAILALIVRHWRRFGPAEPEPLAVRRSLAEQIRAGARLAWRTHRLSALRSAVRAALGERAGRRLHGYAGSSPAAQARALAPLTGLDALALQAALTQDAGADRHTQLKSLALLESAHRALEPHPPSRGKEPTP